MGDTIMAWVDIAILATISMSMLISIIRGLMREVLSLLAWVIAFVVATAFAGDLATVLEGHVSLSPSLRLWASFLIVFIVTLLVSGTLNFIILKLMAKTGLSGTDRALGSLFGLLRGLLIIQILVLLAGITPFPQDPWWRDSWFLGWFEPGAQWIVAQGFLPDFVVKHFSFSPVITPADE